MLSDLFCELAEMGFGPEHRLYRNPLLKKHGVPRRSGVKHTTAAFLLNTDPIVLHLKALGVDTRVDEKGRAYFEKTAALVERDPDERARALSYFERDEKAGTKCCGRCKAEKEAGA